MPLRFVVGTESASLSINQQMKRARNRSRARMRMLRAGRGRFEFCRVHKQMICFRVKAHGLCAELRLYLPCLTEVVGRIFVEDVNPAFSSGYKNSPARGVINAGIGAGAD